MVEQELKKSSVFIPKQTSLLKETSTDKFIQGLITHLHKDIKFTTYQIILLVYSVSLIYLYISFSRN